MSSTGSMGSVWLEGLTGVEAEETLKRYEVVLIPLGARTKEHGPHMPLNTDWIMAEYLAWRVAAEVSVVAMPTLQYGHYPSFLEYPGAVSLGLEAFKEVVKDICTSMAGYGVRKFYVLNTGVSTMLGLRRAAEELKERGIMMKYTDILKAGAEAEVGVSQQEGGTHADEMETSMMLHIRPEVVDMAKAVRDYHPRPGRGLTRDPYKRGAGAYSVSGVFGDATLASAEKGRIVVEALVRHIVAEVKALIQE